MRVPSLESLLATAMRAMIRRAIWSLPRKYVWIGTVVVILISVIFGGKI